MPGAPRIAGASRAFWHWHPHFIHISMSSRARRGGNMLLRHVLALIVIGLLALPGNTPAAAQTWPTRPVTMVVPFPPGGGTDVLGRIVAQKMSEILRQQVIVENVGGAGGMIGSARGAPPTAHR